MLGGLVDAVRGRHHDRRRDQRPRAAGKAVRLGDLDERERRREAVADLCRSAHDRAGGRRHQRRHEQGDEQGERAGEGVSALQGPYGQPTLLR